MGKTNESNCESESGPVKLFIALLSAEVGDRWKVKSLDKRNAIPLNIGQGCIFIYGPHLYRERDESAAISDEQPLGATGRFWHAPFAHSLSLHYNDLTHRTIIFPCTKNILEDTL